MAGLSFEEARDHILDVFKAAWDAGAASVNAGHTPTVEYQNVAPAQAPLGVGNEAWARIMVRHLDGEQRTIGATDGRVFSRHGLVTVQVFVPAGKQGLVLADRLGKVAADAFEGKETAVGAVWFRNVAYREVGVDGAWFQVNVTAEFEYHVVK